jgi:predicted Zn-dependent peptidase
MKVKAKATLLLRLVAGAILPWANYPLGAREVTKVELPSFHTVKLENGLTLFLLERHELPLFDFHWLLKTGGSIGDPSGREGLASLTASLLRKGTSSRTADQLSEALDFVGASFHARASLEYSTGSAEFVKKDLELAVDLLSDMLLHPSFPREEVSKLIRQEVDGIKEAKEVPERVIDDYYEQFLFDSHPYGRPVGGTELTLTNITREEIITFYESHYVPNELWFAVVGDFSAPELEAALRAKFGSWKSKPADRTELKTPVPVRGRHALIVDKPDATQTFFRFGNVGLARTNADWVAVRVINTLFGGRFTSMINTALRTDSGLTYFANSMFAARRLPGPFAIASFTPNEKTGQALELGLDVLKKLHETAITAEQLQSAKTYLKGQFGPTLETNDQLASMLCELAFYGLGPEYINTLFQRIDAVTLADAKRIIETYYPQNDLDFVFIGQSAVIEPVAAKLAPDLHKKSITEPGF